MLINKPRPVAYGLIAASAVVVAVTVLAATLGGSPGHGGQVYVWPFEHPYLGTAAACVMLGVAARLVMDPGVGRIIAKRASILGGIALLVAGFAGYHSSTLAGANDEAVVAKSDGFEVISYRYPGLDAAVHPGQGYADVIGLFLRSRRGLASYESRFAIACFTTPESGAGPGWLFGRAFFSGTDEVTVTAKDGSTWRIPFDPGTLHAPGGADRCHNVPDPAAG